MADDSELSQDEINDLLGSIEEEAESGGDEAVATDSAEDSSPAIKILDLHRPDIFTHNGVQRMNAYVSRWVDAIANAVRLRFGQECTVEAESIDLLTYDELIRTVPNPGVFIRVSGGFRETFLLEMTEPLSSGLIRLALGYPTIGDLTPLQSVHRQIGGTILSSLVAEPIASDLFLECRRWNKKRIEDPALIALTDPYEMVVVVAISVTIEDESGQSRQGRINLSIPSFVVDRLVEQSRITGGRRDAADTIYRGKLEFHLPGVTFSDVDSLIAHGSCHVDVSEASGALRFSTPRGALDEI